MAEIIPPAKGASFTKRKVGGVPVIYLVGGFVLILAVVAWRMKPSGDLAASDNADATDAGTDAANPAGVSDSLFPNIPSGTVVAAPAQPAVEDVPYEDNSTWLRKGVAFLIAKGKNPGDAQLALQHYLSGADLSYDEGALRDMVVREYGLPPDSFDAGKTNSKPVPPPASTPKPAPKPAPTPSPKPVPKPSAPPPKPVRYYVVRSGDNLTSIGRKYGRSWQQIYAANRSVIGGNPNLIFPGQRLRIP